MRTLMPESLTFEFPAPVLKDESNPKWTFHYVPIPPEVAEALVENKTRRVILTVNERATNRYVYQHRDGEYRVILGLSILKELGHRPGDMLFATLKPDPNPDAVNVPPEFEEALAEHPEARKRFDAWTPGKRRSLASYITQAKRPDTRMKRAFEIAYKMETYTLYGDKKPKD